MAVSLLTPASLLAQMTFDKDTLESRLRQRMQAAATQWQAANSVVSQADKYLSSYYGRDDFSSREWARVQDFKRWLKDNEESLNKQFAADDIGRQYNSLSAEQKEAALGTWLGMKYAVDVIGEKPNKSFPVKLEEDTWNKKDGDRADKGSISITKGSFVEKMNVGLHEAVHLMPNASLRYGYTSAAYGEKYAVAAQQRYGLPVKEGANAMAGARSFFPAFQAGRSGDMLGEYTEGISALIDYDNIWKNKQWDLAGPDTSQLLGKRLQEAVVSLVEKGEMTDVEGYSPAMNKYLKSVAEAIAEDFRKDSSGEGQEKKTELVGKYFDQHSDRVAKVAGEQLRSVASQNLPPVPKGYM